MKTFKMLDLIIQLITIVFGLFACLINFDNLLYAYPIVGGWQLFSCLIHGTMGGYYPYSGRRKYLWTLLGVLLLGIFSQIAFRFKDATILYLGFLLIFSPLMALYYWFVCYKEVKLYQQKEWIQLK